jgi:hypothetical protein
MAVVKSPAALSSASAASNTARTRLLFQSMGPMLNLLRCPRTQP